MTALWLGSTLLGSARAGGTITPPPSPDIAPVLAAGFSDLFEDAGDFAGRPGWTAAGDPMKAAKIVVRDGTARMVTSYNGGAPDGWQVTAPLGTANRTLTVGYDFSQTGQGSNEDPDLPFKVGYQAYAIAFQDPQNLIAVAPAKLGDIFCFELIVAAGGVITSRGAWNELPAAGRAVVELRGDRVDLWIDDRHIDPPLALNGAAVAGGTALNHQFWPVAIATTGRSRRCGSRSIRCRSSRAARPPAGAR